MPKQAGVSHVALTVTDLGRSTDFYRRLLDAETVFSGPDQVSEIEILQAGSLLLGLRRHPDTETTQRFDHRRVGLDHLGIAVDTEEELEQWRARLDELGIQHSGVERSPIGIHLNARDPDDIPIEFFTLPQGT